MATAAVEAAIAAGLAHEVVAYGKVSSAAEAAAARGIELQQLVKTIVVRRGPESYVLVLVPGDRAIAWPKLRSSLGVSRLSLPDADEAYSATGYRRGTITPLGATGAWPVYMDHRLLDQNLISIGSGAHGVAINCNPADLAEIADATVGDYTKNPSP